MGSWREVADSIDLAMLNRLAGALEEFGVGWDPEAALPWLVGPRDVGRLSMLWEDAHP